MRPALKDGMLLAHHAAILRASCIDPQAIVARGYRSVSVRADLKRLGFGDRQLLVPTLLIPIYSVTGEIVLYQHRPDTPRMSDRAKPIKYETPKGARMVVDVPPGARARLGDPKVSLFITEGVKKADAAVSHGLCCIALLGVWNWRGTNDAGGKMALPEWESIALNGRSVYIVFDSDAMTKRAVFAALCRLKSFLESRRAQVLVIYLGSGDGGAKVGLDDYLAAGHTAADLLELATTELREPPTDADEKRGPYRATPTGLVWMRPTTDGAISTPLTNFVATIVGDVQRDDGVEITRALALEATLHERPVRFTLPATQFAAMAWPIEHLGAEAVIYPGSSIRSHAQVAIQLLSGTVPSRLVYTHTGWRKIGDAYVYLNADGAIGASGLITDIEVDLGGKLSRYRLPPPPTGPARVEAVRRSLALLDLGPLAITVPAVAWAYLAPLCTLLDAAHPDFVVWLVGGSGLFKSEMAALVQAHFGEFTRLTLPASFEATANSIERMLFTAKDAVMVIDDYHPATDPRHAQAMAAIASRLLRGVGNGTGRSRMRADTTLREDLPPRGLALATGERLPSGHSNLARVFPVPFVPPGLDVGRLTAAQESVPLLPLAMAAYLQWIATHWEKLANELPTRFGQFRTLAQRADGHRREPGQLAHLYLALDTFLHFAVEVGATNSEVATKRREAAQEALQAIATEQAIQLADEKPVRRFLSLLSDGFASRRIYVEAIEGGAPLDAERWGWELRTTGADDREDDQGSYKHNPIALLVGKVADGWLCLHPEVTYQYVTTAARSANQLFPVELRTLLKNLADEDLIATQSGRHTVKVRRVGDRTTGSDAGSRVIKLRVSALFSPSGNGEQGEHGEQKKPPDDL